MADNSDIYVRKDVFDARMNHIEALLDRTSTEIRYIRDDIQRTNMQINSMKSMCIWEMMCFMLILTAAVVVPIMLRLIKTLFQPSVTIKDVERIVNEAIAQHLSGGAAK